MLNAPLENRMAEIEDILAEVARLQAENQREISVMLRESREFKTEMREFKDEMREFKDEMRGFKDEMREFKDEMRGFKDEMQGFKTEMSSFKKEVNQKFGEAANKMGMLVEDMVAPSMGRIFQEVTGCKEEQILFSAIRVKLYHAANPDLRREFDAVVAGGDYVLINETKSQLDSEAVGAFIEVLQEARDFFPQYKEKKVIGALASLYIDTSLVRHIEKQGLIAMAVGQNLMDVLNSPGFKPKEF
jgi:hypothetical protein